jgi:hypothetical protein
MGTAASAPVEKPQHITVEFDVSKHSSRTGSCTSNSSSILGTGSLQYLLLCFLHSYLTERLPSTSVSQTDDKSSPNMRPTGCMCMQVSCSIPVEEIVNISEQAGKAILQIYNSAVSTCYPTQDLEGYHAVAAVFYLRLLQQCCSTAVSNFACCCSAQSTRRGPAGSSAAGC